MLQPQEIETVFRKQLDAISDPGLSQQVVATWTDACRKGNWASIDALRKVPFTLLTDTHGIDLIAHTIAVTDGAVALAKAQVDAYSTLPYRIDFNRLIAGGLLHDVGKLLEFELDGKDGYRKSLSGKYARHPISGAILAAQNGMTEDIVNMIACHAKEGDGRPQVIETVFIHQADFATFNPLVMKQKGLLIEG